MERDAQSIECACVRVCVSYSTAVAICGTHAGLEASSPKPLLGISTAADNAHCKDVLGTEAVGMGAEGFTANGVEGAADAGVHTAETPQSAARSLRMEGRLGPAGRACRWGQASSSPGQAEHTASVLGSGGEDPVSAHPTEPTAVGWPAAGARTEGRLQKRSAAAHEAAAAALETEAAAQKAAAAAQEAAAAAVPSSFKGKKHPHRTASAPNVSADVGPGQKPAPEPKLRKDWPGQKPINIENKTCADCLTGCLQPASPHFARVVEQIWAAQAHTAVECASGIFDGGRPFTESHARSPEAAPPIDHTFLHALPFFSSSFAFELGSE
eukprot:1151299-Pelagomonas_calceolata.AAC.4